MYYPMLNKFFETFFRGDFPNKGKQVYMDHAAEVRSLVPPHRLLEYRISEGWGPLCQFLGEEIPDSPFPQGNDVMNFYKRCRTRNRRQMMNVVFQVFATGSTVLAAGLAVAFAIKRFFPGTPGVGFIVI